MKWIGLTGGIATGKSTVKKLIEGRGFPVVDADFISHAVTEIGQPGYDKVLSHFGKDILNTDGSINRKALGALVFQDSQQRGAIENILHPLIKEEVARLRQAHLASNKTICFYDVPLLFEKNLQSDFDRVVLVWCDYLTQKDRLKKRNQLSENEALVRIAAQNPMGFKIKKADHCLDNSSDLDSLTRQVQQLLKTLQSIV